MQVIKFITPFSVILTFFFQIHISMYDGTYIKNIKTGNIRLELGPQALMLSPEEILVNKKYSTGELEALKIDLEEFTFLIQIKQNIFVVQK